METRKIKIMASYDWSMRYALHHFLEFLDPVISHEGKEYKVEFDNVIAKPLLCGQHVEDDVDFVIDRTTHWNDFYKFWAQQAMYSGVSIINNPNTFFNYDKHIAYDIMARAMHPDDHFPTTVLLPQFHPYTRDQELQQQWKYRQELIAEYTKHGYDDKQRETDWATIEEKMKRSEFFNEQGKMVREQFYVKGNYIKDVMEKHFDNKFPIYLKKASGGGGVDVFRIKSMEELYSKYDEKCEKSFHLQEAIEDYDHFIRCLALGPQVLPMNFLPDTPLHEHYGPEKPTLDPEIQQRIINYTSFINSYHRWTYNSFEAIIKDGKISPIDFANACPDSHFTSLHVHFPWAICALLRWSTFCAVTRHDLQIDMEQKDYLNVLNDSSLSQVDKYDFCNKKSAQYFAVDKFRQFCEENFADIKEKMIEFYDQHFDGVIRTSIYFYEFPKHEHEMFYKHYKNRMETIFRPNAMEYLTAPSGF